MTVEKEWASETAISTGPDTNVSALAFDGESITVGGLRFKRGRNMSAPYMPMYWGDYLGDTQHLTAIEHGGYLLLIAHYWRTGGIPSDPVKLARICRMSNREWTRHGDTILEFFSDGKHGRIDRELQKVEQKTAKMRNAAETRWNREREPKSLKSLAPVDADALPLQDKCNDNQNQNHIHKKKGISRSLPLAEFEDFWKGYPRKVGKLAAEKAYVKARRSTSHDEIMFALSVHRFSDDPQYIPHPATWLNRGSFLDEAAPGHPVGKVPRPNTDDPFALYDWFNNRGYPLAAEEYDEYDRCHDAFMRRKAIEGWK